MKYGVIVCPNCRKAKAVNLAVKTTTCIRCGKRSKLDKLRIFYKTDSQEMLRKRIGLLNAESDGKVKDFKKHIRDL